MMTGCARIEAQSNLEIDQAICGGAAIAIGVSGGKDSQAAAILAFRYLDRYGHAGPRILIHSDLGSIEWKDSHETCARLADYLNCELVVVRRKAGGLIERWERRWELCQQRYEELSTVTLVPCWSTPSMRFCTSELKTNVITAELKRRFKGMTIVNVTGIRRQESRARSKATVGCLTKAGMLDWRPIVDLSVEDVFAVIDDAGISPHPAYREFGMSRVSCRFCIMSNVADLIAASDQPEAHDCYRQLVSLECRSSFAFQGSRWLGDIAPHLLSSEARQQLTAAKRIAVMRRQLEGRIEKGMLYVSGWPTRMLSDREADILAGVRSEMSELLRFNSSCLDRDSIHARYATLINLREQRAA